MPGTSSRDRFLVVRLGRLDGFLGLLASGFPQQRCQPQRYWKKRWAFHVSGVILVSREKLEKRSKTTFLLRTICITYAPRHKTPMARTMADDISV
jgi:hypothetical protein